MHAAIIKIHLNPNGLAGRHFREAPTLGDQIKSIYTTYALRNRNLKRASFSPQPNIRAHEEPHNDYTPPQCMGRNVLRNQQSLNYTRRMP
jgi:hypothetical protein